MATEIRALIEEGAARLRRAADDPRREAELLLAAALGRSRASLLTNPEERIVDCDATDRYESHVTRRAIGEPVAYILGEKEFWSLTLAVTPDVLVPRPETELVVERALAHLAEDVEERRVLDLATGSGAIALAIAHERPPCRVLGTDASGPAVALATANARRLGLANTRFETGSWYEPAGEERFDVITCNPPYVADGDVSLAWQVRRHEPHTGALCRADGSRGAADGDRRRIRPTAPGRMARRRAWRDAGRRRARAVRRSRAQGGDHVPRPRRPRALL